MPSGDGEIDQLGQRVEQLALQPQAGQLVVFALDLPRDQRRAARPASSKPSFCGQFIVDCRDRTSRCSFLAVTSNVRLLAGQVLARQYSPGRSPSMVRVSPGRHALELLGEARDEAAAADLHRSRPCRCRRGTPRRRSGRCSRRAGPRPSAAPRSPSSSAASPPARGCAAAMSASALSTVSGGASAFRRVSSMAPKSGSAISGSSSSSTLNSRSAGSAAASRLTRSTFGCIAGRRPRSLSTWRVASLTDSSSTSAVTARAVALAHHAAAAPCRGGSPAARSVLPRFATAARRAAFDVGGRHDDREGALQPLGERLGDLHCSESLSLHAPPWCGRRDLNPHGLRHQNLNLACLPIPPRPRPHAG